MWEKKKLKKNTGRYQVGWRLFPLKDGKQGEDAI